MKDGENYIEESNDKIKPQDEKQVKTAEINGDPLMNSGAILLPPI